jgi:hypothetical protein
MPACWYDINGKVQYIYTVTIHEDGLSVTANWPQDRADDLQAIPGASTAPGSHLSLQEFGRRMAPVLAWSKRQNPECRHYVYMVDEAASKNAFKRNMLFTEGYFYKYLQP